jgi:hypothetical protein
MSDKKLITTFRNFVEKVFLPNIKKTDSAFSEWIKFNQLLSIENNYYDEVAQYVDSLPGTNVPSNVATLDKREAPLFKKRAQDA